MKQIHILAILLVLVSCSSTKLMVRADQKIDYSNAHYWAALPSKKDPADLSPDALHPVEDGGVDIFFLYPTSLLSRKDASLHNAPIDYKKVNNFTDKSSIKYQASIFNQVGRIYAPRYRQAHIREYYNQNKTEALQYFEIAYQDVKNAFQYYLDHYNQGRPIIIASHSQGTTHGMRLVKEYFDGTALQEKLVAAYLLGMPVPKDLYSSLEACDSPDDINCINSWRSWKHGHIPKFTANEKSMIVVNPLAWTTTTEAIEKSNNKGAVLRKFEGGILKGIADAQIYQNILWIHKPKFPGSVLYRSNNFHIADFNFFYMDIRENALRRKDVYLKK